jgi:hypothetical protein
MWVNYGERKYRAMHRRSKGWHTASNYPSLSQLLKPFCLEGSTAAQQQPVWRLSLLPVSGVRYRLETPLDAKWVAERVVEWPHYRDVTPFEELCPVQITKPVVGDDLFPWIWKFVGTVAAITLGLLLGVLARSL